MSWLVSGIYPRIQPLNRHISFSLLAQQTARQKHSQKERIDWSRVPVLKEEELEESFIKGSGPGGSNVNKTVSCVFLKHIPSGIGIKCQFSRLLQENRKIARERLVDRLDQFYNGDMSIQAQKERILEAKSLASSRKTRILNELKRKYKERLSKEDTTSPTEGK